MFVKGAPGDAGAEKGDNLLHVVYRKTIIDSIGQEKYIYNSYVILRNSILPTARRYTYSMWVTNVSLKTYLVSVCEQLLYHDLKKTISSKFTSAFAENVIGCNYVTLINNRHIDSEGKKDVWRCSQYLNLRMGWDICGHRPRVPQVYGTCPFNVKYWVYVME